MLNAREREERDNKLRAEWLEVMARVRRANEDLIRRADAEGVTIELHGQALKITIGVLPPLFYTQRGGGVRMHVESGTDKIAGFVIEDLDQYVSAHGTGSFGDLLPALRVRGVIHLPPQSRGAGVMGRELVELVPA